MSTNVLSQSKYNVYAAITKRIADAIEAGAGSYRCPWHRPGPAMTLPTNAMTRAEYRGVNVLSLWIDAQANNYASSMWATYKQWQNLGAQVRGGEHGSLIVFYKRVEEQPFEADDPNRAVELRHIAKPSWVFNATQVDGYSCPPPVPRGEVESVAEAEAFVSATKVGVQHGYKMACYNRRADVIEMPDHDWFAGTDTSSPTEAYYATLLHELTHWSGAPHRLNRDFGRRFGDDAYAVEELVAEFGSAFLCGAFGIASEPRPDHAAYIAAWLKILRRDSRAVFTAASRAQEAFEHLAYLATNNGPTDVDPASAA